MITRRNFLQTIAVAATSPKLAAGEALYGPFGGLVADPDKVLDLPPDFRYRIISRQGDEMDDGLLVPPRADGMAAFDAGDGRVALVCNHENHPSREGAFGPGNERLTNIDPDRLYDAGGGRTPGTGGTTTIIYEPATGRTLRRHLSLAGTEVNCAGGPTPWGSWLSCEECFERPGPARAGGREIIREQPHGYVFEVPWRAQGAVDPQPIRAMGRFEHEATAIHPPSGVVYMSEDRHRSLLYRYIPNVPGELSRGGRLQALAIADRPSFDTRNWETAGAMPEGHWHDTYWIDIDDPDPEENNVRLRGFDAGAARFARGEGLCFAEGSLFMTATIGGHNRLGQVFEYRPSRLEGADGERDDPGQLRLLAECSAASLLRNADNLTMSPWGDLIVCEDTVMHCGLVGLTPEGRQYELANNPYTTSELAGICFSPDGGVMFVNIQDRGLTLAITGPWPRVRVRA
jgi:secreted PhoX family phosphatase